MRNNRDEVSDVSKEDHLMKVYLFYVCVLILKTLFMVVWTSKHRCAKKIFISPEDASFGVKVLQMRDATVKYDDEDIERIRRAHLNDLENIPIFIFTAFIYILTKPNPMVAINLFRVYTLARFLFTFVYAILVIPQPARGICFVVGYTITVYMAIVGVIHFFSP